jgi:hypothetical protein
MFRKMTFPEGMNMGMGMNLIDVHSVHSEPPFKCKPAKANFCVASTLYALNISPKQICVISELL